LTVAWLLFAVPVLLIPGWKDSVALLVFISIYANVAGHWSSYQGVRAEKAARSSATCWLRRRRMRRIVRS
jgi:hypothetical protein